MPAGASRFYWQLVGCLTLGLFLEALLWRTPNVFSLQNSRLSRQCARVAVGMDETGAVAMISAYDSAFRSGDSHNPQLVFKSGGSQCVLSFDENSKRVMKVDEEKVLPEFSPEERFQPGR
jgi:hypothetical protein